jgi:hypothetical protein
MFVPTKHDFKPTPRSEISRKVAASQMAIFVSSDTAAPPSGRTATSWAMPHSASFKAFEGCWD